MLMKINHYSEIELKPVEDTNVSGVSRRLLITARDGAPNFTMRLFHVKPGGYTFHHAHDFEHEIFIIEGEGEAITAEGIYPIKSGYVIFVSPGEVHQFKNSGSARMSFLCLVPNRAT